MMDLSGRVQITGCSCAGDSSGGFHVCNASGAMAQTLSEMEFERGLWGAARDGNISRIRELLSKRADPNAFDVGGYAPLHYAARRGSANIADVLLASGADVNAQTMTGRDTPLHRAAFMGHESVVAVLLENGALPTLQNADGDTALHKALEQGKLNVAESLANSCPAALRIRDNKNRYPLERAPPSLKDDAVVKRLCSAFDRLVLSSVAESREFVDERR